MSRLTFTAAVLVAVFVTGCATEQSRRIVEGETTEVTAGVSEDDIRIVVSKAMQDLAAHANKFAAPEGKLILNVKTITADTTARGSQVSYIMNAVTESVKEAIMESDLMYLYDEATAQQTGNAAFRPNVILSGSLQEQNVRRDNGNFYREYQLLLRATDVASSMLRWTKRVPLRKAIDKANAL